MLSQKILYQQRNLIILNLSNQLLPIISWCNGSVVWLVMEENERKEVQSSNMGISSLIRQDKKVIPKSSKIKLNENYLRDKGAGDCVNIAKEMETLPLRTGEIRAQFQDKINEENKMKITALVERLPDRYKDNPKQRKPNYDENFIDTPDNCRFPNEHLIFRSTTAGCDSTNRPLRVVLPKVDPNDKKDYAKEEHEKNELSIENRLDDDVKLEPKDLKKQKENVVVDIRPEEEPENDCVVNCIYYTQQFCDCSIL